MSKRVPRGSFRAPLASAIVVAAMVLMCVLPAHLTGTIAGEIGGWPIGFLAVFLLSVALCWLALASLGWNDEPLTGSELRESDRND